jgi:hypothetical protein
MVLLPEEFDASSVPTRFGMLPEGRYVVAITKTEIRSSMSGTGQYLAVEFTVQEPAEHLGRTILVRVNVFHDNPVAREYAKAELAAICVACGKTKISDTDELLRSILVIDLRYRSSPNGTQYPRVVNYYPYRLPEPKLGETKESAPRPPRRGNGPR